MGESKKTEVTMPEAYTDTLPPEEISDQLAPVIAELGLAENCRQLAMEGWTVVEEVASQDFIARFRSKIKEFGRGANMLLAKDPIFAEAVLNPKVMAMAEFSLGRGFLLTQVACTVRPKGSPGIALHSDQALGACAVPRAQFDARLLLGLR